MRGRTKVALLGFASINAIISPAFAQEASPAQAQTPSSAESEGIQEIVVTANKRNESLQKVPISITSITAESLDQAGISSTAELSDKVAGFTVQESGNGLEPHIRGIGTTDVSSGNESAVATYVDGVYISVLSGAMMALDNIQQVDVLKGPQGTLFGRNATGGLINIRTLDPTQSLHLKASVSYGDYGTTSGNFYITGGLSNKVAADFAAYGTNQSKGYGTNQITGSDIDKTQVYALRTKWLLTPADWLTIRVSADKSYTNNNGLLSYHVTPGTSYNVPGRTPYIVPSNPKNPWDISNPKDPIWTFHQQGVNSQIDVNTPFANFTSITAYRTSLKDNDWNLYALPTATVVGENVKWYEKSTEFSQELQMASLPQTPIKWVTGAYFLYSKTGYDPFSLAGPVLSPLKELSWNPFQTTYAEAVYGQTAIPIFEDTNLTLGARYSIERKAIQGGEFFDFMPSSGIANFVVRTNAHKVSQAPTWRFALDHQFTPEVLGYFSYNRGFKSGTYPTIPPGGPGAQPVQPEKIDAYELGVKSDLFDRTVRLDAAAFLYEYREIQVDIYTTTQAILENGGAAQLYGFDLDLTTKPTTDLTVNFSGAYVHDRYTNFRNGSLSIPLSVAKGGGRIAVDNVDLAGKRLTYTPTLTFNLGTIYNIALPDDSDLILGANYSFNSGFYGGPDNTYNQGAYFVVNANAAWELDSRVEIKLWGKNLTNKAYATFMAFQNNPGGFSDRILAPPRTFGVTFSYSM